MWNFVDVVKKPTKAYKRVNELAGFFISNKLNTRSLINVNRFSPVAHDGAYSYQHVFDQTLSTGQQALLRFRPTTHVCGVTLTPPHLPRLCRQSISLIDPKFQFDTGLKWREGESFGPVLAPDNRPRHCLLRRLTALSASR